MSSLTVNNIKFPRIITRYTIFFLIIVGLGTGIRFYFFPSNLPLNADALYYFWYSSDIYQIGKLPEDWAPLNMGWPIFVSIFFTLFDSKDIFTLMEIQRVLSVIISILIAVPTYFLCKKFVARKFALVGVSLIVFDPRLMINSFLGVTDALYILLVTTSLILILSSNKKIIYFSFVLVAFATITRGEGLIIFLLLSTIFLIKFRKDRYKIFLKYFIALGIFMLIVLPFSIHAIEVTGVDGIFIRSFNDGNHLVSNFVAIEDSKNKIIDGFELFLKYFIWVLIPNFIIFVPIGLFLIFKNRNFEKNTIILSLVMMSIPAFYVYMIPALDTRYLYVLFPIFSILSAISIEKICDKLNKQKIILVIIIIGIIISSLIFYNQQKIDYDHEKETFNIMEKISSMVTVTNVLYQESSYLKTSQTLEQWPSSNTEMGLYKYKIILLPTDKFNSLNDFITESKDNGLTHIIVDNKKTRQDFLVEIFNNEDSYTYFEKIYDSKIDGFTYHLKVFKIDYEKFDSMVNKESMD
jgi:4-amino-4-deoxy-L-arabinose transferase-like glycosyltransferase